MTNPAVMDIKKPAYMTSRMKGRIEYSEFHNGHHMVSLMTPAKDEFSKPSEVIVKSERALGNKGDIIEVEVEISGFINKFQFIDKQTSEQKTGRKAITFFEVIS